MKAMTYRGPYKLRVEEQARPGDRASERRDRPRRARGDLRIGPAPVPRHDARHPDRPHVRARVHRHGRAGRRVGAEPQGRRPRDGAVQHLLRLVLLLRARAVLELPQRQPERHGDRRHLRLLALDRRLRRRTGRDSSACRSRTSDPSVIPDDSRTRTRCCSPTRSRRDTSARSSPTSSRATPRWCSAPARSGSRRRARAGSWAPAGSSSWTTSTTACRRRETFAYAETINFGQVDDIVRDAEEG